MRIPFEAVIRGELEVPDHLVELPDLPDRLRKQFVSDYLMDQSQPERFDVRPPATFRTLDLSTRHIAEEDRKWLCEPSQYLISREYEYGWWIHVNLDDADWPNKLREFGIGPSILQILQFARDHQCHYIFLDQDGTEYDELPSYDW